MTNDEAMRLTLDIKEQFPRLKDPLCVFELCDYILSGDMKREIENAAFERVSLEIDDMPAAMFSGDYEAAVKNRAFIRNKVHALIQPPAQKENGE